MNARSPAAVGAVSYDALARARQTTSPVASTGTVLAAIVEDVITSASGMPGFAAPRYRALLIYNAGIKTRNFPSNRKDVNSDDYSGLACGFWCSSRLQDNLTGDISR
jgi:hypothetical protein